MEEKRKAKRMPISLSLEVLNLYKQETVMVSNLTAPIEVVNISQTGIGFRSESILPIGYYFNASIQLGEEDTIHCVVKIVRRQAEDKVMTMYGCEFVGMASVLSYLFDEYDLKQTLSVEE